MLVVASVIALTACSGPAIVADVVADPELRWSKDGRTSVVRTVSSVPGPSHCEWESATFIHVDSRPYVRAPENVVGDGFREGLRLATKPPDDARDSGFRAGELELWIAQSDDGVFLRLGDDVERWPPLIPPTGCA